MEGQSSISRDVLARYAADAASEVDGVSAIAHRGKGVEIGGADGALSVAVHIELDWGRSAGEVAREVQARVSEYLERMANAQVAAVDVVVDSVGAPPAKQ